MLSVHLQLGVESGDRNMQRRHARTSAAVMEQQRTLRSKYRTQIQPAFVATTFKLIGTPPMRMSLVSLNMPKRSTRST
jgi:hypothetical protein